jgi:hypothetical protein
MIEVKIEFILIIVYLMGATLGLFVGKSMEKENKGKDK